MMLEMLKRTIGKLSSIIYGNSIEKFELPDSKYIVALKEYDNKFYAIFRITVFGDKYSFEISQSRLSWMLSRIDWLRCLGAKDFVGTEDLGVDLGGNMKFEFAMEDNNLIGKFTSRFLFRDSYTYLSSKDLDILYSRLNIYLRQK